MDRARRSHRQLEALIAKLEDRMASLEQRESELQYDLNTNSLPYISTSDDPSCSDRFPQRPPPRPRTNPERGGYQCTPQSRNFIDLLEDEIRRFQLEKQEADIKWQKRQKELFTQLQSIRTDFLPEPESSRSVDSIQSADIENIQRLNRLAEEVSQKKRKVAELERQLEEKVKQTSPSPEQGVLMQRAPGQGLRPRLSATSIAQLHRIMRELENFIIAIEEEDYRAADQVPSEGTRTTPPVGGDDVTADMIRLQQREIENLKEQLAMVTKNYMVAKEDSDNMRQELNELKVIVLGESSEQKLVKFDETPAEADSEPPPLPEKRELSQGEEDEVNSEEVTKEEVGGTGEEAVPAEEEVIPTEEETVPAEEEAAPAEDEVSTGGEEAAPTEEEAIPSEEGVFTAEGEGGGEEEAAAPAEDEVSTGGEEAAPTEEETAPAEDEVSTGSEEAAPTEEAIPSEEGVFTAEGEGGGEEEEAAPAEDEVSTGGEEAAPTEEAAPAEEEAVPAEQEAALSEEEAVPAIEEAAPAKRPICRCAPSKKIKKKRTAPGGEEAAPTEEEFIQAEEEAAPTEEEAAPAEDEVSTGGEEAVPTEEEFIPAEEEAAPTEEEAAPAEDEVSTGGEEAAPTEEEFIQAEEEAAPAEEEAAPVEEETAPAEDEVSTGGEEAAPTEEEFIQAEEEAAPTEEEAAPAEDKVSTGGEEAAPTEEEFIPAEEEAAPAEEEFIPAEEEAAPSEEEAAPVEEEAVPSGEEAAPSEEGVASFEEPVVISEEGPEVLNEDEDEDLVFTDVSKECCCPEGQCVCCLAEGLESCRLSPIEKQYCIIPGDAEAPDVHEQSPSEPMIESRQLTLDEEELVEEKPQLTLDEVESVEEKPSLTLDEEESVEEKPQPTLDEEFVKEKPTEELPKVRTKCLCAKSRAAVIQPGAGDRPVPEETKEKTMKSAVQEPPKPDVSEENVQQILASAVDGTSKFSEERTKSIVADMLLDIAARVTAEHSVDNAEDLTRALEAELEQKEYCLTNEDIQKIMEDIIDSYTQEPCEKEALAGIIKKIVQDVVQNDAEASDEKERVAEDIQVILEGIMQLYSVGPMGEGEPEEAKPEVPVKVIQAPKPIAQVCSSKGDSLQSSTSELGCQVLCWDDSAFQPVVKKTSSTSSDMSCQVLCWNVQVGDEEARVPEPVVETDSDQPMDSEDKTEPLEEVDTDQTVGSEEQAEPAEEVDVEQTVDSEDKTEPVEEVDTDQTVDSEDKAEPVEEVDADQTIEAEEPIEKVDLDEPVDSDDKTEAVEEVGTDQAVDSEDKTEPVEEADKDQPVDSEPVEDVLPEAEETAPEDSQEMPLQEEISATESPSSDVVCEKPGEDEIKSGLDLPPDSESSEGCYCAPSDKMLAKDEVPSTEPSTSDAVCDKPAEGDKSEDLNDGLPPDSESSEGCYCIPSDKMFAKDEVPSSEPPTSDEVRDKPAEGDKNEDFKNKTFVTDAHRLERVSSSISQLAYEFPLQNEQPYRIEKVTSSIETCAFEFGSYKNTDNTPCIEGTDDTIGEVSSISPEGETEGGIDEMEEQEDDTNDIQETGDLSEEGSPAAPEVTAEDAEETEDGSEQVSPIDHEGSVDDIKETDGGEEVSPIISESGIDEPNEREGVSEEVVIAPEGGVDESKETPEETCPISSGGEQEIPEQNMVDENTANVQEQILESECKEDCDCTCITTRQEWKPNGDEIVEKPETTNEVIVDEKADGGIEEKSESIEQGEPVKTSTSRDSKKRPSSGASKERVRESSIDRKRRWSKVKEEDSDLRVQINELNKRMAVKSKMLLDMEANLNALKGGAAPKGDQKLPLTKSAMAMVFAAIRDGLGALSCRCFMGGSPLPQPPCAPSSCDPLENSQPCPCASCCIPAQDIPPVFPCGIKCPFHMPPPPCNRWLLQRPPCCLPPGPGELVVRRVDHDSLLVRWGACRNPSVTGFDIYVNGSIVHRIRGTGRSIAMLTGLNLGGRTVICVYAMTPCGTYGNPMSTVYQPPSCVPCCKMRKNGNNDKYSLADEIGKNKTGVSEYRCL